MSGSQEEPHWAKRPHKRDLVWPIRHHSGGKGEYYERAAALSYVGDGPRLLLGMERIKPGERELTAAIRLSREAALRNNKYSDTICTDDFYKVAPLIRGVTLWNSCPADRLSKVNGDTEKVPSTVRESRRGAVRELRGEIRTVEKCCALC